MYQYDPYKEERSVNMHELCAFGRTYRRFYEDAEISRETLLEFIDNARMTASAHNKQVNRYFISCEKEKNAEIFSCLRWAAYYTDWFGPEEGERPTGYIVMIAPQGVNAAYDEGIRAQTIVLSAAEKGLGGCIFMNIDRERLATILPVPEGYKITLAIALGKPKEVVEAYDIPGDGDVVYHRDENQVHHVPKVRLSDLVLN